MILSKREKLIAIVASIALAIPITDRLAVRPFLAHRESLKQQAAELETQLTSAELTMRRRRALQETWGIMLERGVVSTEGESERMLLTALQRWSQDSGFALATRRPDQVIREGDLRETIIIATGTGNMRSLARFIYLLETSELPVRVRDLQLTARRDGADDLSMQMRVSGIFLREDADIINITPAHNEAEGGAQ